MAVIGPCDFTYSGNTITGNTYNTAMGTFGTVEGTFYNSAGLPSPITAYVVLTNLTANSGRTLVIQPGAVVKFLPGQQLVTYGTLTADGEEGSEIIFTSFSGSGATMTISNNNRYGIYLSSSSPTISGCVIAENGNHGIYLASTSQPIIGSDPADLTNWNDIHDNGGYELYNDTANDIIAMPVWWGTLVQAEIEAHIYDREDNPAKGRVLFIPWDGRNESGEKAASGVYFYSIQTGSFTAIRRMVILR